MDYRTGELYSLGAGVFQIQMIVNSHGREWNFKLEVSEKALEAYEGVSDQHYTNGEDIVVIAAFRPIVCQDGVLYRKASQMDYDRWMKKMFPSSVNAAIYKTITRGIHDHLMLYSSI